VATVEPVAPAVNPAPATDPAPATAPTATVDQTPNSIGSGAPTTAPVYPVTGANSAVTAMNGTAGPFEAPPAESTDGTPVPPESTRSVVAIARSFAAGTAAGFLPFALPSDLTTRTTLAFGPIPTALVARINRSAADHTDKPSPAAGHGSAPTPRAPSGPPGSATAGSSAAAASGASSGLSCAILVGLITLAYRELRRHLLRPVLAGPIGVVDLLQRPG
jgi:hypothetical protein